MSNKQQGNISALVGCLGCFTIPVGLLLFAAQIAIVLLLVKWIVL